MELIPPYDLGLLVKQPALIVRIHLFGYIRSSNRTISTFPSTTCCFYFHDAGHLASSINTTTLNPNDEIQTYLL